MSHSNYFTFAVLIGLATTVTSCSRDEVYSVSEKSRVSLNLHHFGIEQDAITRASADRNPHRIAFKAFDSSGAVAYETVQASTQQGYGTLDFELSPGSYTFVAVAHDLSDSTANASASIAYASQATVPEALVQDTFCDTLNVDIKPGVPFSSGMTLPRIISCFKIKFCDVTPAGTKKVKIVANTAADATEGNPSFDPSTGLAVSNRQYIREVDISSAAGRKNNAVGINLFLTAQEQNINVTVTAYDADGHEIISHTLKDVPMKRNRTTTASGNFFTAGGSGSFSFSTNWDPEAETSY